MRALVAAALMASVALAGCVDGIASIGDNDPDEDVLAVLNDLATFPEWRLETNHGTIRAILYTGWTPITTGHIIQLTDRGFYDGTIMHRVVDDFVIQGGDPTETGEGGSGPLGTSDSIPLEIYEGLDFGTGAIGLARWTDDTGDSQYFIGEKPAIHLSQPERSTTGPIFGAYSLWAQVFEGHDVVRDIADTEVDANDKPTTDVVVHNATVLDPPMDANLINLIPRVVPDISTQGHTGDLEIPRFVIAGHQTVFRFTTDSAGGPCNVGSFVLDDGETRSVIPWTRNGVDACTFEHRITFDDEGPVTLDLGVDEVDIVVLPWSSAYKPFQGIVEP